MMPRDTLPQNTLNAAAKDKFSSKILKVQLKPRKDEFRRDPAYSPVNRTAINYTPGVTRDTYPSIKDTTFFIGANFYWHSKRNALMCLDKIPNEEVSNSQRIVSGSMALTAICRERPQRLPQSSLRATRLLMNYGGPYDLLALRKETERERCADGTVKSVPCGSSDPSSSVESEAAVIGHQMPFVMGSLGVCRGSVTFEVMLTFTQRGQRFSKSGKPKRTMFVTPLAFVGVAPKRFKGQTACTISDDKDSVSTAAASLLCPSYMIRTTDGAVVTTLDPEAPATPYATDIFISQDKNRGEELKFGKNNQVAADGGATALLITVHVSLEAHNPHIRFAINHKDCGVAFRFILNNNPEPLFPVVVLTGVGDRAEILEPTINPRDIFSEDSRQSTNTPRVIKSSIPSSHLPRYLMVAKYCPPGRNSELMSSRNNKNLPLPTDSSVSKLGNPMGSVSKSPNKECSSQSITSSSNQKSKRVLCELSLPTSPPPIFQPHGVVRARTPPLRAI